MVPDSFIERRGADRHFLQVPASITLPTQQTMEVRTLDVSASGLTVVSQVNLRLGTSVSIRCTLLSGGSKALLESRAQVIQSIFSASEDGFRVGLQLLNPSPAAVAAIAQCLK